MEEEKPKPKINFLSWQEKKRDSDEEEEEEDVTPPKYFLSYHSPYSSLILVLLPPLFPFLTSYLTLITRKQAPITSSPARVMPSSASTPALTAPSSNKPTPATKAPASPAVVGAHSHALTHYTRHACTLKHFRTLVGAHTLLSSVTHHSKTHTLTLSHTRSHVPLSSLRTHPTVFKPTDACC